MIKYCTRSISTPHLLSIQYLVSQKRKWKPKSPLDEELEAMKKQYSADYFQTYRKEAESQSVLKNFRQQIFQKEQRPDGYAQYKDAVNSQQTRLNQLLSQGSKQQIAKNSKKIMHNFMNNKKMFKNTSNKEVFKNYADYSAYKGNYASLEDRNYDDYDFLHRGKVAEKGYEFIGNLPDGYEEKESVRRQLRQAFPAEYQNMTMAEYGERVQKVLDDTNTVYDSNMEIADRLPEQHPIPTYYEEERSLTRELNDPLSPHDNQFQTAGLSPTAKTKIYELYMQGWTIRDISRRFGILPRRAKFVIWARARLFTEFLPKYGIKFIMNCFMRENESANANGVMDYGLDIPYMKNNVEFGEIRRWNNDRVDAQRHSSEYTLALQSLEKEKKFTRYECQEVGTHDKDSKMYSLQEWHIYRGKGSDSYFLNNKTLKQLREAERKSINVYY